MGEFIKVGTLSDLKPGETRTVDVRGVAVALYNVGGAVYATANQCAHRGGPLGDGSLDGAVVTCPWHGFQFDVTNGQCATNPALSIACYQVRIDGQDILVSSGE